MRQLLRTLVVVAASPLATLPAQSPLDDRPASWGSLFDPISLDSFHGTSFGGEGELSWKEGALHLGFGSPLTGVTWHDPFPVIDYEIELQAARIDGDDFFCGLTFPVVDRHCTLVLGGWGGSVCGLSTIDGRDASENATTRRVSFKTGRFYRVRVAVTAEHIRAWLDDDLLVDQPLAGHEIGLRPEMLASRPLGIASFATHAAVRGARVRPLQGDPAAVVAGYAAKVLGSGVFVAGRSVESMLDREFAPETRLATQIRPLLEVEVDRSAATCTVAVPGARRTAVFRPGLGCALAAGSDVATLQAMALATPVEASGGHDPRPWPRGSGDDRRPWPADVDRDRLLAVVAAAFDEPAAGPRRRTYAVLVAQRGRLLAERYADGFDASTPLAGWSMTKSIVNALVGVATAQGRMALDQPLQLAAWRGHREGPAPDLRAFLQMSSGLAFDERYDDPGADAPRMLFTAPSAAAHAAARPRREPPGGTFHYSSGTTNMVCQALRETFARHPDYLRFPREALFGPLGMASTVLETDPSGTFVGSSFCYATARDWGRFGQLFLQDGVWDGERLLPEGWVMSSTTPAPTALRGQYGMHWWLNVGAADAPERRALPQLPRDLFYASGFEGQTLAVFPTEQLVVVRLGCSKTQGVWRLQAFLAAVWNACRGKPNR